MNDLEAYINELECRLDEQREHYEALLRRAAEVHEAQTEMLRRQNTRLLEIVTAGIPTPIFLVSDSKLLA